MNDDRRKMIEQARTKIGEAKTLLEIIKDEEEGAKENLPESMQNGEKGEKMDVAIEKLEESIDSLETIDGELEEAMA